MVASITPTEQQKIQKTTTPEVGNIRKSDSNFTTNSSPNYYLVLPDCPKNKVNGVYVFCFGSFIDSFGGGYVGEYFNNNRNGNGIEYGPNGLIVTSGWWKDGKLLTSYVVDLIKTQSNSQATFPLSNSPQASAVNQTVAPANQQQNFPKSNLPPCQGSEVSRWTNCFGTQTLRTGKFTGEFIDGLRNGMGAYTYDNGDKFVGEYKNQVRNGRGVEYKSDGTVITSGNWSDGKLTTFALGTSQFPFDWPLQIASTNQATANERDRIAAEVEAERKKRQELEQQLAVAKERDRITANLDAERRKRQELEEQLRVAQQPTQPGKPTVSSVNERRVALVIGNATYKVNPLKNPVNDSTDMARSLRSVGFEVIEANNTTLAQMREATRRFSDKLGNSDVGLVYYSGHGVEVKGKNYLIPVNADIKREYEVVDQAFDASQFLEMMDNIRGPNNKRVNILIVDACRNNELQKSWRSTNNGLARMDAPGGTFISFATAPGRVAADGVGRNSPYTKHLLQALKQPNVPIEQVFKVVRRNVMEETKGEQIPWENSSLVGDFYFTIQR
jgi:hypothetical protein